MLDFGLAMRLERQDAEAVTVSIDTQAEVGRIAGTLAYRAPEVLRGEEATARSDIWALGGTRSCTFRNGRSSFLDVSEVDAMNSRFAMATLVGAVVLFVAGFLIFGLVLNDFYMNSQGTATGINKDPIEWPWMIASTIANAAFLTLVLGWAGARTPGAGFRTAALVGLLMAIAVDFGMYSMTNVQNLTITLVDPAVAAIYMGIGGAVIGLMLGRGASQAPSATSA